MSLNQSLCPVHGKMSYRKTRFGGLWVCEYHGCTYRCWTGSTSSPADAETRELRERVHSMFDPLWEDEKGPFVKKGELNSKSIRRKRAYCWLSKQLGLERKKTHVGMFDKEQCWRAISVIQERVIEI